MTSAKFNARKAEAKLEMEYFDRLTPALQAAVRVCRQSVKSKTIFDAMVRGVSEATLLETIHKAGKKNG